MRANCISNCVLAVEKYRSEQCVSFLVVRSVVDKTYSTHHSLMNGRVEYQDGLAREGGLFSTRYTCLFRILFRAVQRHER